MSDRSSSSSSVGTNPVTPVSWRVVWMTSMSKPSALLGDRTRDTAEADQSERGAVYVAGQVGAESPSLPSAFPQVPLCVCRQAGRGEDQQEGQIGRRVVEHPGRVAHRDAHRMRGGDVDVVVAHGGVRHDAQPPVAPGLEHGDVDAIGEVADDPVTFRSQVDQLVGGEDEHRPRAARSHGRLRAADRFRPRSAGG